MKHQGKGVACMFYPIGFTEFPNPSAAFIKVEIDGSAVVYTGATDIGQGSTTVLRQIAGEVLGIQCENISMVTSDTLYSPHDSGTVASRITVFAGNAVKQASEVCRKILFEAVAAKLNMFIGDAASQMKIEDGKIYPDSYRDAAISIAEAARYSCLSMGKPVVGSGTYNAVTMFLDKEDGRGKPYGTHVFAVQIAFVTVDDETGEYSVDKIYAVHDCGKAINPMLLHGQIHGGIGNGVGFGCTEEVLVKNCKIVNDQFKDYIIPTALDMPEIISEVIERPDPAGVFGAKGIGEPALLPTASAICNAIYDAVGVMVTDLPITPEKVYFGLKKNTDINKMI